VFNNILDFENNLEFPLNDSEIDVTAEAKDVITR
jgi:hypothetical protein